jgi:hypothetical protein
LKIAHHNAEGESGQGATLLMAKETDEADSPRFLVGGESAAGTQGMPTES